MIIAIKTIATVTNLFLLYCISLVCRRGKGANKDDKTAMVIVSLIVIITLVSIWI